LSAGPIERTPAGLVEAYQDSAQRRAWEAKMLAAVDAAPYTLPEARALDCGIIRGEIGEPRRFQPLQERQVLDWCGRYCYACFATGVPLEIDHCVPHSHDDGLTICIDGVPACKPCNLWKAARSIDFRLPEYHGCRWFTNPVYLDPFIRDAA
jgi:hypothetical protein